MNVKIGFIMLLFVSMSAVAQEEKNPYLNNSGYRPEIGFIRVYPINIYLGDFALSYEHLLRPKVGIEVGAGLLMPFHKDELVLSRFFRDEPYFEYSGFGRSLLAGLKFYQSDVLLGSAFGLYHRRRSLAGGQLNDSFLRFASQRSLLEKYYFATYFDVGLRSIVHPTYSETPYTFLFSIKLDFAIPIKGKAQ